MENASKALIIAASVLVAIMLVAFGVTIFNKARNGGNNGNLDSTEISMFNQQFEKYSTSSNANDKILGSQVKSLISTCISNASTNKDNEFKLPEVTDGTTTAKSEKDYITNLTTIRNSIQSNHSYHVTLGYGGNGYINTITIGP